MSSLGALVAGNCKGVSAGKGLTAAMESSKSRSKWSHAGNLRDAQERVESNTRALGMDGITIGCPRFRLSENWQCIKADDCHIYVESKAAGELVMELPTDFLGIG